MKRAVLLFLAFLVMVAVWCVAAGIMLNADLDNFFVALIDTAKVMALISVLLFPPLLAFQVAVYLYRKRH